MNNKILYIVWYPYARRAETLSRELNAKLVFVYEANLKSFWLKPLRYIIQGWKTWRLLEQEHPAYVIVQSPPTFAPLAVALWCKFRSKKRTSYFIDTHPGNFYHRHWRWALPLLRPLARGSMASLLCNEDAQETLQKWVANYIFLPDGLPDLSSASGTIGSEGDTRIAVISTIADDEPIAELFEAARLTPQVTYYLTGNPARASKELLAIKPENIVLTGFLRGSIYNGLLHKADGIMILSKLPTTLSCGAFEALSLAKPTIVSDLPEQRRWFSHGFILVVNTPEGIARGVELLLSDRPTYTHKAEFLREEYSSARQPKLDKLISLLK
jgi:glycosyltransferase involved in cell wall biosynthesis